MNNFFEKKAQLPQKCVNCSISKKGSCEKKIEVGFLSKKGQNKDILIILEMPESESFSKDFLSNIQKQKLFNEFDYEVVYGIKCRPKGAILSSPVYKTYEQCNCITEEKYGQYKVIITIGRALYSITKSSDIGSWRDFSEFLFNPTYFYTGIDWTNKIRVYPIPLLSEWLGKDNFNNFFVKKQFEFIYKYLKNYSKFEIKKYDVKVIENPDEYLESNLQDQTIAWDIETSSLNHFSKDFKVGCISITNDGNNAIVLKYDKIRKRLLSKYFEKKYQLTANGKFDTKALTIDRIQNCRVDEDVTLLSHVLSTVRTSNGLKTLAWQIGLGGYDKQLDKYINDFRINNYLDIPENILYSYAGMDVIVTYRVYEYLKELCKLQPEVYNAYKKAIIGSIPVFQKMEIEGMELDFDYVNKLNSELDNKIKILETTIYEKLGKTFNIGSSEQLARILEEQGFPSQGRSKKKFWIDSKGEEHYFYNVGEAPLQSWKQQGYEIADLLLQYRSQLKLKDTFVGEYEEELNEQENNEFFGQRGEENFKTQKGIIKFLCNDNKIHPVYNPGRADTVRSSCNSPNLQQMPHKGEEGKLFRPVFKCPEGYLIGEADQSGFQLRIAAIYSNDKNMKDVFLNKGGDMHSLSAKSIFHKNMTLDEFLKVKNQEPYATSRFKAKNQINFPLLFSSSPYVIYDTIKQNWSEEEMDQYIEENKLDLIEGYDGNDKVLTVVTSLRNEFFNTYSGLRDWIQNQREQVVKKGYTTSYHGIKRHLPQLLYTGQDIQKSELRNLMNITINSQVQSFEAYVIYCNMIKIDKAFTEQNLKSKIIGMIHDSVLFYIHKSEVKQVYEIVKNEMSDYTSYPIPIVGELKLGTTWGYGEEVTDQNIGY